MPTVVNTELTTRRRSSAGSRPVEAEDVADEIVDALEVRRFDVFVPRVNGGLFKFRPCCRAARARRLGALMGVDKLMTEVDHGARRAYEERAANGRSTAAEAEKAAAERDAA